MSEINIPERHDYEQLTPFKLFVKSNFPFIEATFESLDNYGLYCEIVKYLNQVISNQNKTNEDIITFTDFVTNYFENLDVQEEINNKLDEMTSSGELQELLDRQYEDLKSIVNNQILQINNKVDSVTSGSPSGVYSTVSALTTADPNHDKIYVVTADGHWYYYNNTTNTWTSGGVYQSTGISTSDPVIQDLYLKDKLYNDYIVLNENASFTTAFNLEIGDTLIIDVQNNITSPQGVNVFTLNHLNGYTLEIRAKGRYEFTPVVSGPLRFYFIGSLSNFIANVYFKTSLRDTVKEINNKVNEIDYNYIINQPSLPSITLRKKYIHDNYDKSITKSYVMSNATTIENVENYSTSSSVGHPSPVIRIRNNNGALLYDITLSATPRETNDAIAYWAFDKSGKYLNNVLFKNINDINNIFASNVYYVIFNEFPTVYGYADLIWLLKEVNIDWLKTSNEPITYTIGANGDFTTFTEMLTSLEDDKTQKIVYVDEGEYDIFEELGGAEYMETLIDSAPSLNWRDVNKVVPPNTHIIGKGNVTLKWIATAQEMQTQAVAFLFSPLNLSGTCTIENINVVAQNCRYAVHDETSGQVKYNGAVHHFINCNFKYLQSDLGVKMCYGAGHNVLMKLKYDNCSFYSYDYIPYSNHDHNATDPNKNSSITFNNCIFKNNQYTTGSIRLSSSDYVGRKDIVSINNCYLDSGIIYSTEGATNVRQGYDVTLLNSSKINTTYSDEVTTRYDTIELNPYITQ